MKWWSQWECTNEAKDRRRRKWTRVKQKSIPQKLQVMMPIYDNWYSIVCYCIFTFYSSRLCCFIGICACDSDIFLKILQPFSFRVFIMRNIRGKLLSFTDGGRACAYLPMQTTFGIIISLRHYSRANKMKTNWIPFSHEFIQHFLSPFIF